MGNELTEQHFRLLADEALDRLERSLAPLADARGFEVERQGGVLNVEFEVPSAARFVISPNAPVRQVWVSALGRGYKLAWAGEQAAFALNGESLNDLVSRLVQLHLAST